MVNNRFLSDISLETRDGVVYAHKYALVVRCPTLLKVSFKTSNISRYGENRDFEFLIFLVGEGKLHRDHLPSFQSIEKVSKVDLQDFSKDAVVALLRYLYIDDMSPKNIVAEELEKLAVR